MAYVEPSSRDQRLLVAFASIALWALLLVVSRIVLVTYEVDPWSFTFVQLIAGGAVSVAASGRGGTVDWSSLRRIQTWLYGGLRVITASAFTAALAHTTVTYAGLLGTTNVVFGVIGAALVFGRRPGGAEYVGLGLIVVGVSLVIASRLEGGVRNPAVALMLISEVAVVGASLLAESHPDNAGHDRRARLRFSGVVLLATATLFLLVRLLQEGIDGGSLGAAVDVSPVMWIAGILVGVTLRGPAMYTSLNAIRLVGAEVYLMVAASLAFIGLAMETVAGRIGVVEPASYGALDVVLPTLIAAGAVSVFAIRQRAV
ncbi:MAG: DMT family transporter [Actinomycetota bacterium]